MTAVFSHSERPTCARYVAGVNRDKHAGSRMAIRKQNIDWSVNRVYSNIITTRNLWCDMRTTSVINSISANIKERHNVKMKILVEIDYRTSSSVITIPPAAYYRGIECKKTLFFWISGSPLVVPGRIFWLPTGAAYFGINPWQSLLTLPAYCSDIRANSQFLFFFLQVKAICNLIV